ncbi:hypothetical protein BLNAU_12083 [Blattamonas nauphoetae]|uniref:Uncharacterized protein n=1 Tax=Blattamonas nauphoetae TaxID=2049346 RepID=A0ABQ9XND9_9EUKA|nr:hypothetical protein BLNAU_12083 [Blattamonas nauphoetae]
MTLVNDTSNDELIARMLQEQFDNEDPEDGFQRRPQQQQYSSSHRPKNQAQFKRNVIPIHFEQTYRPKQQTSLKDQFDEDQVREMLDGEEDDDFEFAQAQKDHIVHQFVEKKHIISDNTLAASSLRRVPEDAPELEGAFEDGLEDDEDDIEASVEDFEVSLPPHRQRLIERVGIAQETAIQDRTKKSEQIRMTLILNQNRQKKKVKFVDYPSTLSQLCSYGTKSFNTKKKCSRVFDIEGNELRDITPETLTHNSTLYFSCGEDFVTGKKPLVVPEVPSVTTEMPSHPVFVAVGEI